MIPADQRQVVGQGVRVRLVKREGLRARIDGEGARSGDVHVIRNVGEHLDADVFWPEELRVRPHDARAIDGEPNVVDDRIAQHH